MTMAGKKKKSRLGTKSIQEFAALLTREHRKPHGRDTLRDIDEAMERIMDGTYGICLGTGKPIKKRRLTAIPWAKYSIEHAKLMEEKLEFRSPSNDYLDDLDGPYAA
jgi:RNA polymerase-binding transcription factor DksA